MGTPIDECISGWLRSHTCGVVTPHIHPRRIPKVKARDATTLAIITNATPIVSEPTYGDGAEITHFDITVDVFSNDADKLTAGVDAVLTDLNGARNLCGLQGTWLENVTDITFEDPLFRYRKRLTFRGAIQ